ncbi:MAG: hypothetical protein IT383_03195 [Deltaproteobacteria bacterium]|nr:hypothetical protein [Deltaproteobacteria bacterium]
MVAHLPCEAATGPHLRLRLRDGLPPFEKRAAVAFAAAMLTCIPFLAMRVVDVPSSRVGLTPEGLLPVMVIMVFLGIVSLGRPNIAVWVGSDVHRWLRAMPLDVRPRGTAMVIAARVIGWLTLALWALTIGWVSLTVVRCHPV